jgi:hypothetical protein
VAPKATDEGFRTPFYAPNFPKISQNDTSVSRGLDGRRDFVKKWAGNLQKCYQFVTGYVILKGV